MFDMINRKISSIFGSAKILSTIEKDGTQRVKGIFEDGDTKDEILRIQNHGIYTMPDDGADLFCIFRNGDRNKPMIIAVNNTKEAESVVKNKSPSKGDVFLFTNGGACICLRSNGKIEIHGSTTINDKTDFLNDVEIHGNVSIKGSLEVSQDLTGKTITQVKMAYNNHIHNIAGDKTTPTAARIE